MADPKVEDIFPKHVSSDVCLLERPKKKADFERIAAVERVFAFVSYLYNSLLSWLLIDREAWDDQLYKNFIYTGKQSVTMNPFEPQHVQWELVENRLGKSPLRDQSNTDVRTGFKYRNIFLVNKSFTFGQRKADRGTFHLYQTSEVPILFYVLRRDRLDCPARPLVGTRTFKGIDQYLYDRFVLQPNTNYVVFHDITYSIVTVQKTLFSLDVVSLDTCRKLKEKGIKFQNPTKHTTLVRDPYTRLSLSNIEKAKRKRDERHRSHKKRRTEEPKEEHILEPAPPSKPTPVEYVEIQPPVPKDVVSSMPEVCLPEQVQSMPELVQSLPDQVQSMPDQVQSLPEQVQSIQPDSFSESPSSIQTDSFSETLSSLPPDSLPESTLSMDEHDLVSAALASILQPGETLENVLTPVLEEDFQHMMDEFYAKEPTPIQYPSYQEPLARNELETIVPYDDPPQTEPLDLSTQTSLINFDLESHFFPELF